jgi:hypothetical protein
MVMISLLLYGNEIPGIHFQDHNNEQKLEEQLGLNSSEFNRIKLFGA